MGSDVNNSVDLNDLAPFELRYLIAVPCPILNLRGPVGCLPLKQPSRLV